MEKSSEMTTNLPSVYDSRGKQMNRVLDLDLDFFLNDIARNQTDRSRRLDDNRYLPWDEQEVRDFLENHCGLSNSMPVEGKIIKFHDEAFHFWRHLISEGKLLTPFEVIHVDAHADLGQGLMDNSWKYIMQTLLHKPLEDRSHFTEKLGPGNYLVYAIACRWISKLTYVTHPRWTGRDLQCYHFKDFDTASGSIQLKSYHPETDYLMDPMKIEPEGYEPEVPFETVNCCDYQNSLPFSLVVVSRSPNYTPESADRLIPIIEEYINRGNQ